MNEQDRERTLALHNLHVTAAEMRTVREAIRDQGLWELVAQRSRAHPKLYEAFVHILKNHKNYFQGLDPVTKKSALFYTGEESAWRPEVVRAQEWCKRVRGSKYVVKRPFGRVPVELLWAYPIGQSVTPDDPKGRSSAERSAMAIIDYQYGRGASKAFKKLRADVSETTGRLRRVHDKGVCVGTIRASDGFFVPTFEGARALHKKGVKKRVFVNKDAAAFAVKGKSVFAKFVVRTDEIYAGEEVLVVDQKNRLLACGTAVLSHSEIEDMERGMAVTVRHTSSHNSETPSNKL